jgi:hypothetical protein
MCHIPDAPAQLAAYQAVNSLDDRCQHDERLLERRWISSRKVSRIVTVAKAGQSGLRKRLALTWPNCGPREAPAAAACPHRFWASAAIATSRR